MPTNVTKFDPKHPFGVSSDDKMNKLKSPRKYFFLSFQGNKSVKNREDAFDIIEESFVCSRVAVAALPLSEDPSVSDSDVTNSESKDEQQDFLYFHILFELYPNGIMWSSIKSVLRRSFKALNIKEFEVVPLHSFGKGLSVILASDQDPYFFNYSIHKANMLFDLMKVRKSYKIYDLPETGKLTSGGKKGNKIDRKSEPDKIQGTAVSNDQQGDEKTSNEETHQNESQNDDVESTPPSKKSGGNKRNE